MIKQLKKYKSLGNSVSLLIIASAIFLSFWNEGDAIKSFYINEDSIREIVSVDNDEINHVTNGKLIHTTGTITSINPISDYLTNIKIYALKAKRIVEIYQWQETIDENSNTPQYESVWSRDIIDSRQFQQRNFYTNPAIKLVPDKQLNSEQLAIGVYKIDPSFVEDLQDYNNLDLKSEYVSFSSSEEDQNFTLFDNKLYAGSPENPQIGDIRVSYEFIGSIDASVIGQQQNESVVPFQTATGVVKLVEFDRVSANNMFATDVTNSALSTWAFRIMIFLILFLGLNLLFDVNEAFIINRLDTNRFVSSNRNYVAFFIALVIMTICVTIAWVLHDIISSTIIFIVGMIIGLGLIYNRKLNYEDVIHESPTQDVSDDQDNIHKKSNVDTIIECNEKNLHSRKLHQRSITATQRLLKKKYKR